MPPFLQFVICRFLAIPVSLVIITMVLYGGVMLTPLDPQVWQTLGDALVRAGRIEHANQSYEQARTLRQ